MKQSNEKEDTFPQATQKARLPFKPFAVYGFLSICLVGFVAINSAKIWTTEFYSPSRMTVKGLNMTLDFASNADLTLIKPAYMESLRGRSLQNSLNGSLDYCENVINTTSGEIQATCGNNFIQVAGSSLETPSDDQVEKMYKFKKNKANTLTITYNSDTEDSQNFTQNIDGSTFYYLPVPDKSIDYDLNQTAVNQTITVDINYLKNQTGRALSTDYWQEKLPNGKKVNVKRDYAWTDICYYRCSKHKWYFRCSWSCTKLVLWSRTTKRCAEVNTDCPNGTCTNNSCECARYQSSSNQVSPHNCPALSCAFFGQGKDQKICDCYLQIPNIPLPI